MTTILPVPSYFGGSRSVSSSDEAAAIILSLVPVFSSPEKRDAVSAAVADSLLLSTEAARLDALEFVAEVL
jgi:hypothetical protein